VISPAFTFFDGERVYYTMKQAGIRNAGGWVAFIIGERVSTSASDTGSTGYGMLLVCSDDNVRIIVDKSYMFLIYIHYGFIPALCRVHVRMKLTISPVLAYCPVLLMVRWTLWIQNDDEYIRGLDPWICRQMW
jgi:hypothetical protein